MWLRNWDDLPVFMKTDEVRPYYEVLRKKRFQLIFKRVFDVICSFLLIVLLSPIMVIVSVWIKTDSEGPVFYKQKRITQYGREFYIYKFRTMIDNADKIGTLVTLDNDSRITKVGLKIRKCRLDEIPQLLNVLKGDMSFVGTRPEVQKYVSLYTKEMYATLLLPAGITSLASIEFKNENIYLENTDNPDNIYVNIVLPKKMQFNLMSLRRFSIYGDIKLCFKTVKEVI